MTTLGICRHSMWLFSSEIQKRLRLILRCSDHKIHYTRLGGPVLCEGERIYGTVKRRRRRRRSVFGSLFAFLCEPHFTAVLQSNFGDFNGSTDAAVMSLSDAATQIILNVPVLGQLTWTKKRRRRTTTTSMVAIMSTFTIQSDGGRRTDVQQNLPHIHWVARLASSEQSLLLLSHPSSTSLEPPVTYPP